MSTVYVGVCIAYVSVQCPTSLLWGSRRGSGVTGVDFSYLVAPTQGGPDLCSNVSAPVGATFKVSVYKNACSVCLGSDSLDVFSPKKVAGQFYI